MKNQNVYLLFATAILATASFIATRAARKYSAITCAYAARDVQLCGLPAAHFTNIYISGITKTIYLKTVGGQSWTLITSVAAGAKKVYYH